MDRLDLIPDDTYNPERQRLADETEDETQALIQKMMSLVSDKQRKRLIEYFINGKTLNEIAEEEGTHHSTVDESIKAGVKKIKKYFSKHPEK